MKKNKIVLLPIIIFVALITIFGFNLTSKKEANASSTPFLIDNSNYSSYMSEPLYKAICAIATQLNFDNPHNYFTTDMFSSGYNRDFEANSSWYEETNTEKYNRYMQRIEKSDKIKNDLDDGILDLTIGENARYDCLKNTNLSKIKDISGLNELNLENIKTLIIDDNEIEVVKETDFDTLDSISFLSLKNNKISSFSFNENLFELKNLYLSNNKIKNIDLSKFVYVGRYVDCDLSYNLLSGYDDFVLPNSITFESLNLSFNLLGDLSQTQIEQISNCIDNKKVFLGVQGINDFESALAGTKIKVFNLDSKTISNLKVKISYFEGNAKISKSDYYSSTQNNIIEEVVGTQNGNEILLPAGKLKIEFLSGDNAINQDNFTTMSENLLNCFESKICLSKLIAPIYKITVGDKIVDTKSISENGTIDFYVGDETLALLNGHDEDIKIFSSFNIFFGEEENTRLVVDKNGTFEIFYYCSFDGISSETKSISITRRNLTGIVWGVIIILFIIILFATVFYVVKWIRDGSNIAPLTDRELRRIRKRNLSVENADRESRIEALDKSRHMYRVSDNNYDSDEVYGDLNYSFSNSFERYEDKIEAEMENQELLSEEDQDDSNEDDDMPEDL